MLAGIYYGAQYGGSTTAILVNLPGETSSVVTCIDGHQMARQGRAGAALAIAAIGSFFAGCVGTALIAGFAPPLAKVGQQFGSPDYFSLMLLGLVAAVVLAHGSVHQGDRDDRARPAVRPGRHRRQHRRHALHLRHPRTVRRHRLRAARHGPVRLRRDHPQSAQPEDERSLVTRRSRGCGRRARTSDALMAGGAARHRARLDPRHSAGRRRDARARSPPIRWRRRSRASRRASARARSKAWPAPESANNAGAQTSFIPMLTLGIPGNAVMALMIGAMIIQGIQPGPQIMTEQPDLFWGMIASMWIGNLMLVIINLPLIGIWVKLLKVPYRFLYPAILLFCGIGVYTVTTARRRVMLAAFFGVLGYVFDAARLRAGADAPRLRAGAADGGEPAPRAWCSRAAIR